MSREAIETALFAKLQAAYPWNSSSRVLLHWSDVDQVQQPAMFLAKGPEQIITTTRQPSRSMMRFKVYVYAHTLTDAGKAPSTVMNAILDAITAVMHPDSASLEVQSLGGLVEWARIEGEIETDEGLLGEQAVAIVPITLLSAA